MSFRQERKHVRSLGRPSCPSAGRLNQQISLVQHTSGKRQGLDGAQASAEDMIAPCNSVRTNQRGSLISFFEPFLTTEERGPFVHGMGHTAHTWWVQVKPRTKVYTGNCFFQPHSTILSKHETNKGHKKTNDWECANIYGLYGDQIIKIEEHNKR